MTDDFKREEKEIICVLWLPSPVVGCVTILLQEVILNELSNFESDLISLSKRSL